MFLTREGRGRATIPTALLVAAAFIVGACSPVAPVGTKGTMPPPGPDGAVDPAQVPDFVAVAGREGGIAGYVPKEFVLGGSDETHWHVFSDDLTTVVGHMYPEKGFVPLGVDPDSIPPFPVQQGPSFQP